MKFNCTKNNINKGMIVQSILVKTWADFQDYSEVKIILSDNSNLLFQYNTNTEEIVVKQNIYTGINYLECDIPIIKSLYGASVVSIFNMSNQQGYYDLIQIKLKDKNKKYINVQLKAEGSIIIYIPRLINL